MAFFVPLIIGAGLGAFGGSQVDDAVEVATGEKDGISPLFLIVAGVVLYLLFKKFKP